VCLKVKWIDGRDLYGHSDDLRYCRALESHYLIARDPHFYSLNQLLRLLFSRKAFSSARSFGLTNFEFKKIRAIMYRPEKSRANK
jgi:hypothetical protein